MTAKQHVMHGRDHLPEGADPIPGLAGFPGGDTIDAIIEGLNPAGWWKLNESTGTVAHDSSGNGLDLSVDGGAAAPAWGAPAGPPGEQAADFQTGTGGFGGTAGRVARSWAGVTGDFTAGIFISPNSPAADTSVFGQGNPGRSSGSGWMLGYLGTSVPTNRPRLLVRNSGTLTVAINADNPLAVSTWGMIAAVHDSSTWRLNVNGLDQSSTSTGAYTPYTSPLWIGHDAGLGGSAVDVPHFVGSYAFLIPTALSGAELLAIYNTAILPGGADDGKALLATGLGATYWDFAIQVTY